MVKSLSVVIPAYNEEDNIAKTIRDVHQVLKKTDWDWEIIIVNDGSKDQTATIAEAEINKYKIKNAQVITNSPNRGYGGSLKTGFDKSSKEFIAFVPSDNQFDFSEIKLLVDKQEQTDADIVSGIRTEDSDPGIRRFFRWGWNTLVRSLFGYLASDVDCGFKLFKREILTRVSLPSDGAMVDTELFAGLRARGGNVQEVPVTHLPRVAGKSTGGNPKVIIKALRELFFFWWQLKQEIRVERGKAVFRWEVLSMVIILGAAAFLRLYKIDQYMTFLGDEGRDVMIVREMALGRKFTLIGPGTSIGNMYLGPLYYYLMTPSLGLWGLSPVGPAVMVAGLGILTVALLWWVGRQWFGRSEALLVTLMYAISPTVITYTHSSWNPNIMPFFAILAMYGIWKVWRYGYWRWLIVSSISLAFVLNSHYLGLLLFPVMGFFWLIAKKGASWQKYTLLAVGIFLILMSPLLFFDMRHDWMNFTALKAFFTDRQTTVNLKFYKSIPLLWPLWQQIVASLVTAHNQLVGTISAVVIIVLLGFAGLEKHMRRDWVFLSSWLLVGLIGLGLYKQHIYDHYFGFLYPAVFLALGFAIHVIWQKKLLKLLTIVAVLFLVVLNIYNSPLRFGPNNQLARTKQVADFIVRESGNENFNLALLAKSNYDMSYRYFLDGKYRTVHQEITNQLYVICEDPSCVPIGNPLFEVAAFGWAKIDRQWEFPWGVKLFRLVPNPGGKPV